MALAANIHPPTGEKSTHSGDSPTYTSNGPKSKDILHAPLPVTIDEGVETNQKSIFWGPAISFWASFRNVFVGQETNQKSSRLPRFKPLGGK